MPRTNPARGPSGAGIHHFWAYDETAPGQPSVLRLEGPIASESWWGDEVTPEAFRDELEAHPGDIEVYINSPGGDVIAGSMIYTMLKEHAGHVTVKIEGVAASAASVVAMAGDTVLMAPTAYMMIHNAATFAWGNKHDLQHEADVLSEIDKGIRNAYRQKTGLSERKLAEMMDEETWMSAPTAFVLGFSDGQLGDVPAEADERPDDAEEGTPEPAAPMVAMHALPAVAWSAAAQAKRLWDQMILESANGASAQAAQAVVRAYAEQIIGQDDAPEGGDEAPQSDPTDALRRKLKLLST